MNEALFSVPRKLIEKYHTRDPFQIAEALGYQRIPINARKQKGFCAYYRRNYFIFINENMSHQMQRMTCAHELGHIILHKAQLKSKNGRVAGIAEMELFDITNQTEYEANLFAANLLIDEADLLQMMKDGADIVTIASTMDVNVNLLAIKLAEMKKSGLPITVPLNPDRRFMGHIEDRADSY